MPTTDLSRLRAELDQWGGDDGPATFWWRDDDVAVPSEQLDGLLTVAAGRPLALAAVPFDAASDLATRLVDQKHVSIFQHGWKHENHAQQGPKSEYPPGRSTTFVGEEFSNGFAKLWALFGPQFLPVFTPPWHGFDTSYVPLLVAAGFKGISSKGRRSAPVKLGLIQNNIHCVPIQWSAPPGFGHPSRYVAMLIDHLEQRRSGADKDEATGILTHHLVQTRESLEFLEDVLDLLTDHPFARIIDPADLFDGSSEGLSSVERSTVRNSPMTPSTTV